MVCEHHGSDVAFGWLSSGIYKEWFRQTATVCVNICAIESHRHKNRGLTKSKIRLLQVGSSQKSGAKSKARKRRALVKTHP